MSVPYLPPRLTRIPGIEYPGDDFMRSVFSLSPGQAGTAVDNPQDTVYSGRGHQRGLGRGPTCANNSCEPAPPPKPLNWPNATANAICSSGTPHSNKSWASNGSETRFRTVARVNRPPPPLIRPSGTFSRGEGGRGITAAAARTDPTARA